MGILEGLTSSVGEELSKWTGYRATRAAESVTPNTVVDSGTLDASSADGIVVTLSGGNQFDAAIGAGYRFRLQTEALTTVVDSGSGTGVVVHASHPDQIQDLGAPSWVGAVFRLTTGTATARPGYRLIITSGQLNGESALINRVTDDGDLWLQGPWLSGIDTGFDWEIVIDPTLEDVRVLTRDSATQITLEDIGLGMAFTSQSWQILAPVITDLDVETTLDWPDSGETRLGDAVLYRYDSLDSDTLINLSPARHHGRTGRIVTVTQALITDGEQVTVDDGFGTRQTFEFFEESLTYEPSPNTWGISLANMATASDVKDALIEAINSRFRLIRAFSYDTDVVGLWHMVPGGTGWIHCTDTVASASFVTDGPRGIDDVVEERDEVPDESGTYSAHGQAWRGLSVGRADGADLDRLGSAYGVPRILGLDDERYREYIKAVAFRARHTEDTLEAALGALYGNGRFEIFSDHTFGSVRLHNQIFVRRNNGNETDFHGKLFLDDAAVGARSSLTVTLDEEPTAVGGVRIARDPVRLEHRVGSDVPTQLSGDYRLLQIGEGASYDHTTGRITLASGTFDSGQVYEGDYFQWLTGPLRGQRATVRDRDAGGTWVDVSNDNLTPTFEHPISRFSQDVDACEWAIYRENSGGWYGMGGPTNDTFIEEPNAADGGAWSVSGGGAVSAMNNPVAGYGKCLRLADGGAANTTLLSRTTRIDRHSKVQFFACVHLDELNNPGTTAIDRRQFMLEVHCGDLNTVVRVGVELDLGGFQIVDLLDSSNAFVTQEDDHYFGTVGWQTIGVEVDFATYRVSDGKVYAKVWRGGNWTAGGWVDSGTTSDAKLVWGAGTTNTDMTVYVKWVDWQVTNGRDLGNNQATAAWSTSSANPTRLTAGSSIFVAGDDDVGEQNRVRVKSIGAANASGGCALGEWVIDTYVSGTAVDVVGPTQQGGEVIYGPDLDESGNPGTQGVPDLTVDPVPLFKAVDFAFRWPHHAGFSIEILEGPNAGTYAIANFRRSDDLYATYAGHTEGLTTAYLDMPLEYVTVMMPAGHETDTVELSTALPDPTDTAMVWRLIPSFPTDTEVLAERVVGSTVATDVVTFIETPATGIGASANIEAEIVHSRSGYLETQSLDELVVRGTTASAESTDGLTVDLGTGALTGYTVTPGMFIFVIDPADGTNVGMARIASSTADDVTVESPGFGVAFSEGEWEIWALQAAQYVGGAWTREGGYLADNFGYWVRQALLRNMAAGYKLDFDGLFRAEYDDLPNGLRVLEDAGP